LAVAARFGANLKAARLRLGITQVDLAKLSGLQATRIPSIERGTSDLRLSTAQRLSDALGVPLSDLLTK
jgi:transcriptional regulator with XRE-family HTH domain